MHPRKWKSKRINMYDKMMASQLAMGKSKILLHGMQNARAISDHVECDKKKDYSEGTGTVQANSISGDNMKMYFFFCPQ